MVGLGQPDDPMVYDRPLLAARKAEAIGAVINCNQSLISTDLRSTRPTR
jgi:hypothetical protein